MANDSACRPDREGMLSPYRVLDLTDERGILCGKILADLGADVIQVEPPGGSSARRIGPFYRDEPGPDSSLFWWSYAANKRSITLNLHAPDGRALLKRLLPTADFLVESGPPGELAALGLGYADLAEINPALIVVSITPFGQTGPYANYQAPDLVGIGMAGLMYVTGDPDRSPVRVGFPHFYLHGAGAGAAGAMLAHAHRTRTGAGQHVDVSCQDAVARALANAPQSYALDGAIIKRQGSYRQTGSDNYMRITWECSDGYVNFLFSGGAGAGASANNIVRWMAEEGMGDAYMESLDFTKWGYGTITLEMMQRMVPVIERFMRIHTKQELFDGAVARRILLFPVATPQDICNDPQLAARDYFRQVRHAAFDEPLTLPGPFASSSACPIELRCPPPMLGEHNRAVYVDELGLQPQELARLREINAV